MQPDEDEMEDLDGIVGRGAGDPDIHGYPGEPPIGDPERYDFEPEEVNPPVYHYHGVTQCAERHDEPAF
jgi:hypothetical protein